MRESVHPVPHVRRDLGTPDNVWHRWTSQHRQLMAHGTTQAYELCVERGCREGCTLEDWLNAERDILLEKDRWMAARRGITHTNRGDHDDFEAMGSA